LAQSGSLYELDLPLLEKLQPDVILTQRLCDVCAVSFDRVQDTARNLPSHPVVINLEPHSLADVLQSIRTVADALGGERSASSADTVIRGLESRIGAVHERTRDLSKRPRVFCMEWVNPPYCGGHWMKELVEIAGGTDELANLHRPSYRIEWKQVLAFAPEVMVLTCCGFNLARTQQEADILATFEGFHELPAVVTGCVYATDGSSYFSRPGPRIVDSLEILAHLVHPELFPAPPLSGAFGAAHIVRFTAIRS
jgi:iron complex transport system substrate-binding protein